MKKILLLSSLLLLATPMQTVAAWAPENQIREAHISENNSIVKVEISYYENDGQLYSTPGTGVLIAPNVILTNYHVAYPNGPHYRYQDLRMRINHDYTMADNTATPPYQYIPLSNIYSFDDGHGSTLTLNNFTGSAEFDFVAIVLPHAITNTRISPLPKTQYTQDHLRYINTQVMGYPYERNGALLDGDLKKSLGRFISIESDNTFTSTNEIQPGMSGSPLIYNNQTIGIFNSSINDNSAGGYIYSQAKINRLLEIVRRHNPEFYKRTYEHNAQPEPPKTTQTTTKATTTTEPTTTQPKVTTTETTTSTTTTTETTTTNKKTKTEDKKNTVIKDERKTTLFVPDSANDKTILKTSLRDLKNSNICLSLKYFVK